jgi:hypothetical protein
LNTEFGTVPAHAKDAAAPNSKLEEPAMQKKSLISTLKTAKKADVVAAPAKKEGLSVRKQVFNSKTIRTRTVQQN